MDTEVTHMADMDNAFKLCLDLYLFSYDAKLMDDACVICASRLHNVDSIELKMMLDAYIHDSEYFSYARVARQLGHTPMEYPEYLRVKDVG